MKLGLQINRFDYPGGNEKIGEHVKNIAQAAENAGFYSEWVMDHFFQLTMIGKPEDPMLEAYTTLGYMAGVTQKVKLGTMVTGAIYREPAVLIKAVTALDVLSGGRAYFGIGAGWYEEEAKALGLMNPLASKRFERLEDVLRLSLQMWKDDSSPFKGKQYELPRPINHPQPVSKPHPPILIGGGGEQKTLRLVAQYANACNLFATGGVEELTRKLDILRKYCEEIGRNYDDIEKTVLAGIRIDDAASNPAQLEKMAESLAPLGVSHMILAVSQSADLSSYEKLAPVVEKLKTL